jgi:hypothetical protein
LPTARQMESKTVSTWAHIFSGQRVIVYCRDGGEVSQGTAAWLRQAGLDAQTLEGGFEAWREANQPLLCTDRLPERDQAGRTTWVTRARPKIIRIACPWLIRRFIDSTAVFPYLAPSEVTAVAERFKATPFIQAGTHTSSQMSFRQLDSHGFASVLAEAAATALVRTASRRCRRTSSLARHRRD